MSLFRFANISGPKKIDKKESEKKSLEAKRDAELEAILEKHPSGFSIEEIVDEELKDTDEEEKGNLKDELLNFISKKKELELKDKYTINPKDKEVLELQNHIKEQRFNELKKKLTPLLIAQCEKEYYSYHKEPKNHSYFIGMACNKLVRLYFRDLGISPKKEEEEEIKEKLKTYFKEITNNSDKKIYRAPSNIIDPSVPLKDQNITDDEE